LPQKEVTTTVVFANVHDTPNLLSVDPSALRIFDDQVKSLHAKAVECRPDQWIIHSKDKQQLAYQLVGEKVISDQSEFTALLHDTNLFIQKMGAFQIVRGCTVGDMSFVDKVTNYLKLNRR
jgi:hypothetical protein